MSYDKVVDSAELDAIFRDIANAIREKTKKSSCMSIYEMASEIRSISTASEYTELTYIGKAGRNQYIDTGIKPNQDTSIELFLVETESTAYWCGAWNEAYNKGAFAICNDGRNMYIGYDGQGGGVGLIVTDRNTTVKLDKNIASVNGIVISEYDYVPFQVNHNLYLFTQNRVGEAHVQNVEEIYFKLGYCKIWDNNNLVKHFIPVLDLKGEVCMYDKVTQSFFYNLGDGEFSAGEII